MPSDFSRNPAPLWLIALAAFIGLALSSAVVVPQSASNGAIAVAGIAQYPAASLMAQFIFGFWTVLHQIGAVGLKLGMDVDALNQAYCMAFGGIIVAAYAMFLFGFTGSKSFSIIGAAVIYAAGLFSLRGYPSPDFGAYGHYLGNVSSHTYSMAGGVVCILAFGAVAARREFLAGFCAAAAVAVQPFLGAFVVGVLLALLIVQASGLLQLRTKGLLSGMFAGAGAVVIPSFFLYYAMLPPRAGDFEPAIFETYLRFWDVHRAQPMEAFKVLVPGLVLSAVLVGFIASKQRAVQQSSSTAAVMILIAVIFATLAYFIAHLFADALPRSIVGAIPGRFLSIIRYLFPAILLAALWLAMDYFIGRICGHGRKREWATTLACCLGIALLFVVPVSDYALVNRAGQIVGLLAHQQSANREDEEFWLAVRGARIEGSVLTASAATLDAQQRGLLAVAFPTTSFDFVPYLPHTAGAVRKFVEVGYGFKFDQPSPFGRKGAFLSDEGKDYWARLSADAWRVVSRDLSIRYLMAPNNWPVQLPVLLKGQQFTLYRTDDKATGPSN